MTLLARMTKEDQWRYQKTFDNLKAENTKQVSDEEIHKIMGLLHRHEATINRLYSGECDYGLGAKERKKLQSTQKRVQQLVETELGLKVGFNSDPRGPSIKIYFPSGLYNSMDGETWRINW